MSVATNFNPQLHADLGDELYRAFTSREQIEPLSGRGLDLGIEDAYRIQQRFVAHRLGAGERVVGKKVGLTSRAVQVMLGVDQPDFGQLLSGSLYRSGALITRKNLIQPRAEGEIAFLLRKSLTGPGVTAADVLAATEAVVTCFEIVDSRIRNWQIKIQDTVADNASCGVFVLGESRVDPRSLDLAGCAMVLEKNGAVAGTGTGSAVLGSPLNAVAWLANAVAPLGVSLEAGEWVLSGALSALVPVEAGDSLRVHIADIGHCSVSFV